MLAYGYVIIFMIFHISKTTVLIVYWTAQESYISFDMADFDWILEIPLQVLLLYIFGRIACITKSKINYVYKNHFYELFSFFASMLFYMINNNLMFLFS